MAKKSGPIWAAPDVYLNIPVTEKDFGDELVAFYRHHYQQEPYPNEILFYLKSLYNYLPFLEQERFAHIFIEFLFSCFEVFRSRRGHVVELSLREYCLKKFEALRLVRIQFTDPNFFMDSQDREVRYCVQPLSEQEFDIESLYYPLFFPDYEAVKRLLRYGVRLDLKESYTGYYLNKVKDLLSEKYSISTYGDLSRENSRRLHYILMAFYITFADREQRLFPVYRNYYNSFKLLFKTVTEPLVTLSEFERILKKLLNESSRNTEIQAYLKEFEKLFPKCFGPVRPRTLMHLCRVQVRDSLARIKDLPHGVWRMALPKRIQNYILLQKTETECHAKFVSEMTAPSPPDLSSGDSKTQKTCVE